MKLCATCGEDDQGAFYAYCKNRCKPCKISLTKAWTENNPEKVAVYKQNWVQNNPEKDRDAKRKYTRNNREKEAVRNRKYQKENPGVVNAKAAKRRAKKLAQTPEDANIPLIAALYSRAAWLKKTFGVDIHVDHIKPLSKGGEHTMGNLQLLPAFLNIIKGDKYEQDSE